MSLGDARRAEQATGDALAVGSRQAEDLTHPERAAAWLRARVLRRLRHAGLVGRGPTDAERQAELAALGVDEASFDRLAGLSMTGRAAFAASMIERFEPRDVDTILGTGANGTRRLLEQANRQYLAVVAERQADIDVGTGGPLGRRVHEVAQRAIASTTGTRSGT